MPLNYDHEHADGIAAIERSLNAGFSFIHHTDGDREIAAISAERRNHTTGVIDIYNTRGPAEAVAARYRLDDYPGGAPLWKKTGAVAEVIDELLMLPAPGRAGTALLPRRRSASSLWLPTRGR